MSIDIPYAVAEGAEAFALVDLQEATPPATRAALGITRRTVGAGGVALCMSRDPTGGFWSKTLGFGVGPGGGLGAGLGGGLGLGAGPGAGLGPGAGPGAGLGPGAGAGAGAESGADVAVTDSVIGAACAFYREQGAAAASIAIAPQALPDDWERISADAGLTRGSSWLKLAADVRTAVERARDAQKLDSGLRVERVRVEQAREWASVMLDVFGMPREHLDQMVAGVVGRPGWHAFGVWDGEVLAAVAALFVSEELRTGELFGGATLPEYRGRGAQTALIAARARAAGEAGCRWLVSETGAEAPGTHNSSLHNMVRLGFEPLYERVNWRWVR